MDPWMLWFFTSPCVNQIIAIILYAKKRKKERQVLQEYVENTVAHKKQLIYTTS